MTDTDPSTGASTFRADVWADNWFSLSVGGETVGEDSVSILTEKSFNEESFTFQATRPFTLAWVIRDYIEDDTGLEYIGTDRQQVGDGGFVAQLTDTHTGAVVWASSEEMVCLVTHRAPLDLACASDATPTVEECGAQILDPPAHWRDDDFDSHGWTPATTYSEAEVGAKEGYFDVSWDDAARLVWTSDLKRDNTLLCRATVR